MRVGAVNTESFGAGEEVLDRADAGYSQGFIVSIRDVRVVKNDVPINLFIACWPWYWAVVLGGGTYHPKAFARKATAVPIRPNPRIPNVDPRIRETSGVLIWIHGAASDSIV